MSETGSGLEAEKFLQHQAGEGSSVEGGDQNQKDRMKLFIASVKEQEDNLKKLNPTISTYTPIDRGVDVESFSSEPLTEEEAEKLKILKEKEDALSGEQAFIQKLGEKYNGPNSDPSKSVDYSIPKRPRGLGYTEIDRGEKVGASIDSWPSDAFEDSTEPKKSFAEDKKKAMRIISDNKKE